jgi:hypothetical protein
MKRIPDDIPPISSIRQGGIEIPIPNPAEVKALIARNRSERALLRTLLGLSVRTAEARSFFGDRGTGSGSPAQ